MFALCQCMAQKPSVQSFNKLFQPMAAFPDEQTAIDHFTAIRWEQDDRTTKTQTLNGFVYAVVSLEATLVATDEHSGYRHLGRTFSHRIVRHSAGEYVNGNGIEGFWSLLKPDHRHPSLRIAEAS